MRVWGSPRRYEDAQGVRRLCRRACTVERNCQRTIKDVDQAMKWLRKVTCCGCDWLFGPHKDNAVSLSCLGFGGGFSIERLVLDQLFNRGLRREPALFVPSGRGSFRRLGWD